MAKSSARRDRLLSWFFAAAVLASTSPAAADDPCGAIREGVEDNQRYWAAARAALADAQREGKDVAVAQKQFRLADQQLTESRTALANCHANVRNKTRSDVQDPYANAPAARSRTIDEEDRREAEEMEHEEAVKRAAKPTSTTDPQTVAPTPPTDVTPTPPVEKKRLSAATRAEMEREKTEREQARAEARAEKERKRQEKEKTDAAALATLCGPPPKISAWDGFVYEVKRYLKDNLNDPDSLETVGCTEPVFTKACWVTQCRYRARNGFNALITKTARFSIIGKRVVELD